MNFESKNSDMDFQENFKFFVYDSTAFAGFGLILSFLDWKHFSNKNSIYSLFLSFHLNEIVRVQSISIISIEEKYQLATAFQISYSLPPYCQ